MKIKEPTLTEIYTIRNLINNSGYHIEEQDVIRLYFLGILYKGKDSKFKEYFESEGEYIGMTPVLTKKVLKDLTPIVSKFKGESSFNIKKLSEKGFLDNLPFDNINYFKINDLYKQYFK